MYMALTNVCAIVSCTTTNIKKLEHVKAFN